MCVLLVVEVLQDLGDVISPHRVVTGESYKVCFLWFPFNILNWKSMRAGEFLDPL